MAEQFLMKNEATGVTKKTFIGYSWTMLFFNAFAPLFRADFKTFFVLLLVNILIYAISPNILVYWSLIYLPGFIYSFLWNKNYTERLIKEGYSFAESDDKNNYASQLLNKPNKPGYILCVIIVILNLIFAINSWNTFSGSSDYLSGIFESSTSSSSSASITTNDLLNATPSNISPYGELASIFNPFSDYTDLQREDKLKEIKGKIIEWNLPLYEVSRDGSEYRISVASDNNVGCLIVVNNPNQSELSLLRSTKTGDSIKFKGIISGEFLRSLVISPAIIITPSNQTSSQTKSSTSNKGMKSIKVKFDYLTGSEESGIIICTDSKGKELSFIYDYEDDIADKVDSLKKGKQYTIYYKYVYFDENNHADGGYDKAIDVK